MSDDLVLRGSDAKRAEGAWVFETQGVAAEQGFRNVSQYWYPKTLSFEEGMKIVTEQGREREDITFDVRKVQFGIAEKTDNAPASVTVSIDGRTFRPTDWAARQLCNWLKAPQTMWVHYSDGDSADLELLADAFRNGLRKYDAEKKLLSRTYADGTLRGVMSDSYSIIDSDWYLSVLQEFIPGGRLSHFEFSDADNFCGNILVPDTIRQESDSEYGGMLNCGNSAIGKSRVFQKPSIFRAICMNGCVWGETKGIEYARRHRGVELKELKEGIRVNIDAQIPLLTTKIGEFLSMHELKATSQMVQIFAFVAKSNNLPSSVLNRMAELFLQYGAEKTAFGVVDAITRAGQEFTADVWQACDIIAGQILNGGSDGWNRLNMKASLLTEGEVAKAFGNQE
jgi:hypothetical protein